MLRLSAGTLHLWKGEWTSACVRLDKGISMFRASNIAILVARMVASAAWALAELGESSEALNRLHEARQLLDRLVEKGMVGMWSYPSLAMGPAYLLLGRLDEA